MVSFYDGVGSGAYITTVPYVVLDNGSEIICESPFLYSGITERSALRGDDSCSLEESCDELPKEFASPRLPRPPDSDPH